MRSARAAPGATASTCRRACRLSRHSAGAARAELAVRRRIGRSAHGREYAPACGGYPGMASRAATAGAVAYDPAGHPGPARKPGAAGSGWTSRPGTCEAEVMNAADPLLVLRRHVDFLRVRSAICLHAR